MKSIFGAYDIRGLDTIEITQEFSIKLGYAFGEFLKLQNCKTVLVGYDSRKNSKLYAYTLAQGLNEIGLNVDMMGLTSTPQLNYLCAKHGYCAAAMITASHLSAKYNGFKLCLQNAKPIGSDSGLKEIEKFYLADSFQPVQNKGEIKEVDYLQSYVQEMSKYFKTLSPLKIVVDTGHGSIYPEIKNILHEPIDYMCLNQEPNGDFSKRPSNPLDPGALDELIQRVIATKAHFGAAFDGDGDRVIIVDDKGRIADPDIITALIATQLLESQNASNCIVFYDLRSSKIVPEMISKNNAIPKKCRVGHSYIKNIMIEENGLFAGEMSGHYYYRDLYSTDNALRSLVEVINIVSKLVENNQTLSAKIDDLKKYATTPEINFEVSNVGSIINALESKYTDGSIEKIDGLTINYPNWWFNARASQTEPLLRLRLEAQNADCLNDKLNELKDLILKA